MMTHFNTSTVAWKQPQSNSKQQNKTAIQNTLQNSWIKRLQIRNNCKCLCAAHCSLITITNVKAPPILRIKVFWDVMVSLAKWFLTFWRSCCLQSKQKWTAIFGHRRLQKSIWLSQNDEKTQYHHTLSTPIKSSYDASGIRQFMYTSMSQTDSMSITRVLAELSTQLFHVTNLQKKWVQRYLSMALILTRWQQSFVYLLWT